MTPDGFTTRLRQYGFYDAILAADEIERLRTENEQLKGGIHVTHKEQTIRKLANLDGPSSHYGWAVDEIDRLLAENRKLHVALFHVENGLSHPDKSVRKLIEAAFKASNQDAK